MSTGRAGTVGMAWCVCKMAALATEPCARIGTENGFCSPARLGTFLCGMPELWLLALPEVPCEPRIANSGFTQGLVCLSLQMFGYCCFDWESLFG